MEAELGELAPDGLGGLLGEGDPDPLADNLGEAELLGQPLAEQLKHAVGRQRAVFVALLAGLTCYRLLSPGSEWRWQREWFLRSALADLLGGDFSLAEEHRLYECHDRLLAHQAALFNHWRQRWCDLFNASFDVLAQSEDRVAKEWSLRRRQLKWLWRRLKELPGMDCKRDELLKKLGAARHQAPSAWRLVTMEVEEKEARFTYQLRKDKLRTVRRREGRYLLCNNLTHTDPSKLWTFYVPLTQVEEAFKNLKGDLALRPIHHQLEARVEAHIFIAFLAYGRQVTLGRRLRDLAPGLTARAVREKFATVQMLNVRIPTSDGREVLLTRYTQPEPDLQLLLSKLKLQLPAQPPPKISSQDHGHQLKSCSADL